MQWHLSAMYLLHTAAVVDDDILNNSSQRLQHLIREQFFCFNYDYQLENSVQYTNLSTRHFRLDKSCVFSELFLLFLNLSTTHYRDSDTLHSEWYTTTITWLQQKVQCVNSKPDADNVWVRQLSVISCWGNGMSSNHSCLPHLWVYHC